ncbi:MAG: MFS transporter [Bdellovibrionales bacterium]|nr:MFS transporter [Ramlibacter sp.]
MNLPALITLMVLSHITFTGGRVAISLFGLALGGSAFVVGLLISLLAIVPVFIAVPAGRWTDRVGPQKPIAISLISMSAAMLLSGLWPSLNNLYVTSVLLGTGFMLMHVAVNNAVGHLSTPGNRTRAFTLLALGFSTSSMSGPMIAGFSIDLAGHARTFLILAGFGLVALALLWAVGRRAQVQVERPLPPPDSHVMDLLRDPHLRAVFIVSGLLNMGWDLFTFMVPVQGARIGLSASTIGVIMGTFGAATFVVRLAMPWISRTFSEWQTLAGALTITAFVYYLFPLFTAVPMLVALAFLLGLGLGSAQPMVMSLIHLAAPAGRTGEAVGVRTTVMNVSQTALPLLFGGLGSALGMMPAFWAVALALTVGGVFAARRKGRFG